MAMPPSDAPPSDATHRAETTPLLVRLEGGLVRTDVSMEALLVLLKGRPVMVFAAVWWWLKGRWREEVAARAHPDVAHLPTSPAVLERLEAERAAGTDLWLHSDAAEPLARKVASRFGTFERLLIGSDGQRALGTLPPHRILTGPIAVERLSQGASALLLVEPRANARLLRSPGALPVSVVGAVRSPLLLRWARALRVHQWAKNLLIFVPLVAAHLALDPELGWRALLAFAAFSACASSVYLINDLLDLPSDRRHPRKSRRPFAAGTLPLEAGLVAAPMLLVGAFLLSSFLLPWTFTALLGGYFVLTLAYSLNLKQVAVLDVLTLSGLYTLRLLSGAMAVDVAISDWLLIFSIFLFLSLALVKRVSELLKLAPETGGAHGRGYHREDLALLGQLGAASGYLSVLVLALYIHSPEITRLYSRPEWLWLVCPLALYWLSRVWLLTHRGQMNDDPVVFALRDRASLVVAVLGAALLWLAA